MLWAVLQGLLHNACVCLCVNEGDERRHSSVIDLTMETLHCLCRVPEECPQGIVVLYLSCLQTDPMLRPSAEALLESIEKHMATSAPT